MKKIGLIILASLFFTACGGGGALAGKLTGASSSGSKPQPGETVIFKTAPQVYAEGKVEKVEGTKYEIRYGNTIGKPDAMDVYALPAAGSKTDVKVGDTVVAFSREGFWAGGTVTNVADDVVEVQPADRGSKLNVPHEKIVQVSPAAVADIKKYAASKDFEETGKTKKPVLPAGWKPRAGDRVAAQWAFGSWHPAEIKHVNANDVDIEWKNGWKNGNISRDKIAPYPTAASPMPKTDDYVIVRPTNDTSDWKFAIVTAVSGQEAEVRFADGKTQKLKAGDFIAMS